MFVFASSQQPFSAVLMLFLVGALFPLSSESYKSSSNNITAKWVSNGCSFGATNITIDSFTVNLDDEFTISGLFNYSDVPSEKINITAVTLGVWGPYIVLSNYELNLCDLLVPKDENTECPDDGMYELQEVNLDGLGEILSDSLIFGLDVSLELIFTLDDDESSTELGCTLMTLKMTNESTSYLSTYFGGVALVALVGAVLIFLYNRNLGADSKKEGNLLQQYPNDGGKSDKIGKPVYA